MVEAEKCVRDFVKSWHQDFLAKEAEKSYLSYRKEIKESVGNYYALYVLWDILALATIVFGGALIMIKLGLPLAILIVPIVFLIVCCFPFLSSMVRE